VHGQAALLAAVDAVLAAGLVLPADRVLAVLPLSSAAGLCLQALPALLSGAALRLQPGFDPAAWWADMVRWRPTTSALTPPMLQALLALQRDEGGAGAELACLRALCCADGPLDGQARQAWAARGVELVAAEAGWLAPGRRLGSP